MQANDGSNWLQLVTRVTSPGSGAGEDSSTMLSFEQPTIVVPLQVLRVQDSLTDPYIDSLGGKVDLLITNPPFGKNKYDDPAGLEKMRTGELQLGWKWTPGRPEKKRLLKKADPAALFVDRNLQLLKPGGKLLIVVPDGLLSNAGDRYIRE